MFDVITTTAQWIGYGVLVLIALLIVWLFVVIFVAPVFAAVAEKLNSQCRDNARRKQRVGGLYRLLEDFPDTFSEERKQTVIDCADYCNFLMDENALMARWGIKTERQRNRSKPRPLKRLQRIKNYTLLRKPKEQ